MPNRLKLRARIPYSQTFRNVFTRVRHCCQHRACNPVRHLSTLSPSLSISSRIVSRASSAISPLTFIAGDLRAGVTCVCWHEQYVVFLIIYMAKCNKHTRKLHTGEVVRRVSHLGIKTWNIRFLIFSFLRYSRETQRRLSLEICAHFCFIVRALHGCAWMKVTDGECDSGN